MSKLVVCLTGMPGAGKSTIVSKLKEEGYETFSLGDGVRAEAKRQNLEPTGENLGKLMLELREKNGPGAVAELIKEPIQSSTHEIIFIDEEGKIIAYNANGTLVNGFPMGENYIRVRVAKARDLNSLKYFQKLLGYLINRYDQKYNEIINPLKSLFLTPIDIRMVLWVHQGHLYEFFMIFQNFRHLASFIHPLEHKNFLKIGPENDLKMIKKVTFL